MTVDRSYFMRAMRSFPAAVNVITTGSLSVRGGLTATAVFSLTADPPQMAIAVNRSASAFPIIVAEKNFCINTLSAAQHHVASRFSGGRKGAERFEDSEWYRLSSGALALRGAAIVIDCRVVNKIEFTTHALFVGDVVDVTLGDSTNPLMFVDGAWANLAPSSESIVEHMDASLNGAIEQGSN